MANYWLKLYYKMLRDPDIAALPASVWRLWVECLLLAGEANEGGYLPTASHMAFHLRRDEATLTHELQHLARIGLIAWQDYNPFEQRWYIVNFARLQGPSPAAERMREMRIRKRKEKEEKEEKEQNQITDTDTYRSVTVVTEPLRNVTPPPSNGNGPNPFWNLPANLETESFINAWNAWMQYTDENRIRFSATTAATTLEDLATIGPDDAVRLIRQGIVRGWKSINVDWLASITTTPAGTRQPTNAEAVMIEYAAKRQELLDGYQ